MDASPTQGLALELRLVAFALALVLAVVGVHYEVLRLTTVSIRRLRVAPRLRVAFGILGGLVAHLIEVLVFAVGYGVALRTGLGTLAGAPAGPRDLVYFSLVTYTSLGYGDIVPVGPVRLIAGLETLAGLVLIAWTASFTYIQMERFWRDS